MNIQWYPGHMTKAKRMMQENLKLIDIVIEILDARIPESSKNPDIDNMANGKARLVVLNKSDLSDEAKNKEWLSHYKSLGINAICIDSRQRSFAKVIKDSINLSAKDKIERDIRRGIKNRPIRAMIAGIPNVGKSTFINSLAGKASAKTGNKPGVTKGKQWIKLGGNIELLDTPGLLWPKFDDKITGEHLAYAGSVNEEIIDLEELGVKFIADITALYPGCIKDRYDVDESAEPYNVLISIANARNCIKKGAEPDTLKASKLLLGDFRSGALGRMTLEAVE